MMDDGGQAKPHTHTPATLEKKLAISTVRNLGNRKNVANYIKSLVQPNPIRGGLLNSRDSSQSLADTLV